MNDFCDSPAYKSHPIFIASNKNLELILYYDDFEVCDALGSYKTKHKIGELNCSACMYSLHGLAYRCILFNSWQLFARKKE